MKRRQRGPYVHALSRIFNTPLMILPSALQAMLPGIESVLRGEPGTFSQGYQPDGPGEAEVAEDRSAASGITIIPVFGPLVNRGRFNMAECSYFTGYDDIRGALATTEEDSEVAQRILLMDTPGGEVAGLFDLAEFVHASAKKKPIHCMISDSACSAGFALASACTSRSITQTGVAGSVGVYTRHVSVEAWLKNEGYVVTEFFAGDHKTDGTPFKNLPEDVAGRIQTRINILYQMFVSLVAGNLGTDPEAIIGTKADIFMGEAAVAIGFADRVETLDQMVSRIASETSSPGWAPAPSGALVTSVEESTMALSPALCAALGIPADASEDQALAAASKISETSAAAERQRILAIVNHPDAKGYEAQAVAMAEIPQMTAEAAGKILAAMPKPIHAWAEAVAPASPKPNEFAAMMARLGNPEVGADPGDQDPADAERKAASAGWAAAYGSAAEVR